MTNKKKTFFGLLRVFIFLILFTLCFNSVSKIFVPKGENNSSAWTSHTTKAYIGEKQNSIDVLLVGNSNLYRGFSPIACWTDYGVSSCDSGKPKQTPQGAFSILVDALRYQKPKVIVLETDLLFVTHRKLNIKKILSPEKTLVEKGFRSDLAKIDNDIETKLNCYIPKLVKTGYAKFLDRVESAFETEINYYFPLLKYHYRWDSLQIKDLSSIKGNWHFADKGFITSTARKPYKGGFKYMTVNAKTPLPLKADSLQYLNKIVELCKQKNIKLVLLSIPSAKSWSISKHTTIAEYAKANNLEFIDYNVNKKNNIGFNWLKDTYDGGMHLNIYGAHKVTRFFGKYLKENFQLADHRGDPAYAQWKADVNFLRHK